VLARERGPEPGPLRPAERRQALSRAATARTFRARKAPRWDPV